MPIDPSVAIGADVGSRTFSWTESDVLLYHLGIGAGSREGDHLSPAALRYTLEGPALQVLPSFAVAARRRPGTGRGRPLSRQPRPADAQESVVR